MDMADSACCHSLQQDITPEGDLHPHQMRRVLQKARFQFLLPRGALARTVIQPPDGREGKAWYLLITVYNSEQLVFL